VTSSERDPHLRRPGESDVDYQHRQFALARERLANALKRAVKPWPAVTMHAVHEPAPAPPVDDDGGAA
jgi:hypothetical protein